MWGLRGWWHIKRLSSMCKILYPIPAPKKTKIHTWITWTSQKDSILLLSFLPLFGLCGRTLQVAKDPISQAKITILPPCPVLTCFPLVSVRDPCSTHRRLIHVRGPVRRIKKSYICLCRQTKWPEVNMWLPMYGNIRKKLSLNFPGKGVFRS